MNSADSSVVRSIVLIDDDADFLHVLKKRLQAQRTEFTTTGTIEISTYSDPVEALVESSRRPDLCHHHRLQHARHDRP